MAALNLVTADQAVALLPRLSATEAAAVPNFLGVATRAVEKWCRQSLGYGQWLEYHRPELTRTIRLRNGFVIPGTVELRSEMREIATIACVDPSATRATASLTSATLTLSIYRAGAPAPTALTLSSYTTVGDLAAAVGAISGSGWSCSIGTGYENWLVADVEPNPGAMGALASPARLVAYTHDVSRWAMDRPRLGIIELTQDHAQAFRYPDRTWGSGWGMGWGMGGGQDPRVADVRCSYQAGFDPAGVLAPETPEDLMEAVALTIRAALDSGQFSGVLKSIELGNSKVEINQPVAVPDSAKGFLSAYIKRSVG